MDPGSHRVFFFPEKPRARSPQLPSRQVAQGASELTQGASRASGGYPLDAPVSGSATSAPPDGTAGDGEPKRAQNLMDLVQVDGCLPVDAARAAAAGATAQQPVGARQALAEQRAVNGDASVPRSMELHRVAATDAALTALPHEIPLQPSGTSPPPPPPLRSLSPPGVGATLLTPDVNPAVQQSLDFWSQCHDLHVHQFLVSTSPLLLFRVCSCV